MPSWPGYLAWARKRYAAWKPRTCRFCNHVSRAQLCSDCGLPTSCRDCEDATGGVCRHHYWLLGMRDDDRHAI